MESATSQLKRLSILFVILICQAESFVGFHRHKPKSSNFILKSTLKDLVNGAVENVENTFQRVKLKNNILQLGASYDRGFGASTRARDKVLDVIMELESLNVETNASRFISGPLTKTESYNYSTNNNPLPPAEISPLKGTWRMVWTTASDVLILGANPLVTVGAIYQMFEPPIITNVIDILPRIQNFFPPSLVQNSMIRIKVQTRGSPRSKKPMRVGLEFEKVSLNPIDFLGQDVSGTLPPFNFDLPKFAGVTDNDSIGYFDVTYLDDEMLIIRQNSPGGLFVLVRVDDSDP